MSTPKIVRKACGAAPCAFWLDIEDGSIRGWGELEGFGTADGAIAAGLGWAVSGADAAACGTTLAAIRAELLALETPAPDAPLTTSEREELVALRKMVGWTLASHTGTLDGWEIEQKAVALGLMDAAACDDSCAECCGVPGESHCYRPRYAEDGTPIGEVGG